MNSRPTSAVNPDLDWSQIRETILMINLAVVQLKKSMSEGEDSVGVLTESMTFVMSRMAEVECAMADLPDSDTKSSIIESGKKMSSKLQSTIVAFQFYDKMTQRLTHLSDSLAALGELIGNSQRLYNPDEWGNLQNLIRSKFTIDIDRKMFEAILTGATVNEALAINTETDSDRNDCIELF